MKAIVSGSSGKGQVLNPFGKLIWIFWLMRLNDESRVEGGYLLTLLVTQDVLQVPETAGGSAWKKRIPCFAW